MLFIILIWTWLFASIYLVKKVISASALYILSWLQACIAMVLVAWLTYHQYTPFIRMLLLSGTLFLSMKTVILAQFRQELSWWQWTKFVFCWIGMEPTLVMRVKQPSNKVGKLLRAGIMNSVSGILILIIVRILLHHHAPYWTCAFLSLVGISMLFHFGILNLWAAFLNQMGIAAKPSFRSPLKSKSLSGFWGRDWNMPFVEMTTKTVYQPTKKYLGKPLATLLVFIVSGLFHELAISLPVSNGYGGPLLYFIIQGVFVVVEKKLHSIAPLKMRSISRWVMYFVLIIPLPLLFPHAFVTDVLFPLFSR